MFDFPYNFVMPKLLDFFILLLTFLGSILDLDTVVMCNVVIVYTAVMYVNVVIARVCVLLITLRTNNSNHTFNDDNDNNNRHL